MSREWKAGEPIPEEFCGMPVTFDWNDVALTLLLKALEKEYRPGYSSMCEHVRTAMSNFTPPEPPKPEEPMGLGAVVEDSEGRRCVRALHEDYPWICRDHGGGWRTYDQIDAVKVLSEGVTE